MATSNDDGSQTATGGEDTLSSPITVAGSYVLMVDTSAMVNGDKLILRAKTKVRSVGTTRLATYSHAQSDPVKLSIPIASTNEVVFTLEQTAGTGRAYPWEIVEL